MSSKMHNNITSRQVLHTINHSKPCSCPRNNLVERDECHFFRRDTYPMLNPQPPKQAFYSSLKQAEGLVHPRPPTKKTNQPAPPLPHTRRRARPPAPPVTHQTRAQCTARGIGSPILGSKSTRMPPPPSHFPFLRARKALSCTSTERPEISFFTWYNTRHFFCHPDPPVHSKRISKFMLPKMDASKNGCMVLNYLGVEGGVWCFHIYVIMHKSKGDVTTLTQYETFFLSPRPPCPLQKNFEIHASKNGCI